MHPFLLQQHQSAGPCIYVLIYVFYLVTHCSKVPTAPAIRQHYLHVNQFSFPTSFNVTVPCYQNKNQCISIHTIICLSVSCLLAELLLALQLFMGNTTAFFFCSPAVQPQHCKQSCRRDLFTKVSFSLKISRSLLPEHITTSQWELNSVFN